MHCVEKCTLPFTSNLFLNHVNIKLFTSKSHLPNIYSNKDVVVHNEFSLSSLASCHLLFGFEQSQLSFMEYSHWPIAQLYVLGGGAHFWDMKTDKVPHMYQLWQYVTTYKHPMTILLLQHRIGFTLHLGKLLFLP